MAASYNATGLNGLPSISIAPGGHLVDGYCKTDAGKQTARIREYAFPGLSGAGSTAFGLEPRDIVWDLILVFVDGAAQGAFEDDLKDYQRAGGQYQLESETGQTWSYAQLMDYGPPKVECIVGTTYRLVSLPVRFRDMQP